MKFEFRMQKINPNDDRVQIVAWHCSDLQLVTKGQPLLEVATSKTVVEIEAERTGYLRLLKKKGQWLRTGEVAAIFFESQKDAQELVLPTETEFAPLKPSRDFGFVRFSEAAQALIEEFRIDKKIFENRGLVSKEQVLQILKEQGLQQRTETSWAATGQYRKEEINLAKSIEIEQLTLGHKGPLVSSLTVQLRASTLLQKIRTLGKNLSLQAVVIVKVAELLLQYPKMTAFFDEDAIYYYDHIHFGVAVDTGNGLKVFGIKNPQEKNFHQIQLLITDFSLKDLRKEAQTLQNTQTTFTLTDLSQENILHFQPLINGRQSCILGLGGDLADPEPVVTLTLSFDHRVLTGREVGQFLNVLKSKLVEFGQS